MSEPKHTAARIDELRPGLLHWTVLDDRIGFRSDAYALVTSDGLLLIDPLPLLPQVVDSLRDVTAICLTIQSHQRSSWRYRRHFGVPVWAPRGAEGLEQEPDVSYGGGDVLPGGLRAIHAPGPTGASYALLAEQPGGEGVLFIGDLLAREDDGPLRFVPDEYQDDPARTRDSVRALLELPASALCPGHGRPLLTGVRAALREALERELGHGLEAPPPG